MIDAALTIGTAHATQKVDLAAHLDQAAAEAAAVRANAWIKGLRHALVDGEPLRRRFTFRGDSLWWFTELYLHKQQVVLGLFETIAAFHALIEREQPRLLTLERGNRIARLVAPQVADAKRVAYRGPAGRQFDGWSLARLEARAAWLHATALGSRLRPRSRSGVAHGTIAAFVHRAFWRSDAGDGSAEAYIGPVLQALERRIGRDGMTYVGVGPRANFRARRWWDPLRTDALGASTPIEAFAPLDRLRLSRRVWQARHGLRLALWRSTDLRQRAVIDGCDAWPLLQGELAGVALLQWPWSARVCDEADAALDILRPRALVTYAEAGGWGRALMLASRQRGIPSVGLQHGFIYRHWLNYLHEPDEMAPDPDCPADRGFPRPSATLVFDRYAARHLREAGHFPEGSVIVTGSPRLDALVRAAAAPPDESGQSGSGAAGAGSAMVLLTTKYREARRVLPKLVDAVERTPGAHLAIKTHPAETPDDYEAIAAGRRSVSVLPATSPLASLLRTCRAVVTVNSTVALDAAVLDVPALVIGLPNNLSPFVDAGIMVGAPDDQIEAALRGILYDEEFRARLGTARRAYLEQFGIGSDGRAADRAAAAILERCTES
jgi:hypothetical protein